MGKLDLTPLDCFEIRAKAFEIMTGYLAPGKDQPAAAGPRPRDIQTIWDTWYAQNHECVIAMLRAFEQVMK